MTMNLIPYFDWTSRPRGATRSSHPIGSTEGVTLHWEGPRMGSFDHDRCAGKVRGIQDFHRDSRGWADIAYNAVVCPHGYVFEGRGPGVRSAANGNSEDNDDWYAVCYLGGEGDGFTAAGKQAFVDAVSWLRERGDAGPRVNGHRDHKATACPGDEIYRWLHARDWSEPQPAPGPALALPPAGQVVAWNCKVGDRDGFGRELNTLRGKKVIALLETGGHRRDITAWAKRHGYRIVTGEGEIGASSMLLVHESVKVQHSGVLTSPVKWRGPKGKTIRGRAFPWARLVLDEEALDVAVVHMPWGHWRNVRAWVSCSSMVRNFALNHPAPAQLYVGDWNQASTLDRLWSVLRTTRRIGARVVTTGAPVDYGLYRPARPAKGETARPVVVRGHKGARLGSDHPVVTYQIGD